MGVEKGKTTFHSGGISGEEWEDVNNEDETLAHLENIENSHPMDGLKDQAVITVSNYPISLKILLTVFRIIKPLYFTSFKPAGRWHIHTLILLNVWRMSMVSYTILKLI